MAYKEDGSFGRSGELNRLNQVRNDRTKPDFIRRQADRNHQKIQTQLKDSKLMGMRTRLIKAARAGDEPEMVKIQLQMRDYLGEERETGSYEQS